MARIRAWGRSDGPTLHAKMCGAVTAGSCLFHLWLVAENRHALWLNALMLAMVAVCLPCTVHIWRHLRIGPLQRVMASAVVMAILHVFLFLGTGAGSHHHAPSAAAMTGSGGHSAAMSLGVIGLELTTALLAATLVARLRVRRGQVTVCPARDQAPVQDRQRPALNVSRRGASGRSG